MNCEETHNRFSPYLDGVISGTQMHEVAEHLRQCPECTQEFAKLEHTKALLGSLGPKQAPAELGRRIRIAVASERSIRQRSSLIGVFVRLENLLNAFMVPATAGVFTAIVLFAVLMGTFVPAQVIAQPDVPTMLYVPPRLEMSDAENQLILDAPLVVEANIDVYGRVENYRIISGRDDAQMHEQLNRALLFTVFAPAQLFGRPVAGKTVIYFSHVNVQG